MSGGLLSRLFSKRPDNTAAEDAPSAEKETDTAVTAAEDTADTAAPDHRYIKISFATDKGKLRENNEDSFYIDGKYRHVYGKSECDSYIELTDDTHIYALFDGMGGEAFGETASALALSHLDGISETLRAVSPSELPFYMNEYSRAANNAICNMLEDRDSGRGGSTFTALCLKEGTAYPFYLGDSRIYLYENGGLLQITEDHTLAVRKIKAGVYTEEEAKNSPDHHILTGYLGADQGGMGLDCQPCLPVPLKSGIKLLMCSDGLSDMCEKDEIAELLAKDLPNTARSLTDMALENGGRDNITCVVLEIV